MAASGDELGYPRPPPVLDPDLTEDTILENGVNYASGGGGILNESGTLFIQRFSLWKQIELFEGTQELIRAKIGAAEAEKFFQESKYIVASGSNDFINNYLFPVYNDSWKYNDEQFIKYISRTFEMQLRRLHELGARRVMVFGLGPLGCIPLQRVLSLSGECRYKANVLSQKFNQAGIKLLNRLSKQLPNSSFIFGDVYDIVYDMISNPEKHGFNNSNAPCCTFGGVRPAITCTPASTLCRDRSKYVFWDEYHPTDRANEIVAKELLSKLGLITQSNITETSPASPAPAPAPIASLPP
uniref:GDSL esterase/lipase n=1 Tax=Kalanchoe fedtschenkoi TaxID=63787 RepID=A0A7N0TX13_KALFE